jgi:hypothetical protein
MTIEGAGGWSRREFLGMLILAGAGGLFGAYPGPISAVEEKQTNVQTDKPSALRGCPPRYAKAQEICPHCYEYSYEAI